MISPIVSVDFIDRQEPTPYLLDVRWYLDGRDGHQAYRQGHIPGARFIDLDSVLAAPPSPAEGRHPLPTPQVFADGLSELGVGDHDIVVAYDDLGGMVAGRLVWMLRILGFPAALLDGGLSAWTGPLETGDPSPAKPAPRTVMDWPSNAMATADEVATHLDNGGVVIDARSPERYRGDSEPVDPRAGHIPGAINTPFNSNLDSEGRFIDRAALRSRFEAAASDDNPIVYCGSGVSACHNVLAMEAAGMNRPRLYVGSWSQWSSDPGRIAATGDD